MLIAWSGRYTKHVVGQDMGLVHCICSQLTGNEGLGGQPLLTGCHGNTEFFLITKVFGLEWPHCMILILYIILKCCRAYLQIQGKVILWMDLGKIKSDQKVNSCVKRNGEAPSYVAHPQLKVS